MCIRDRFQDDQLSERGLKWNWVYIIRVNYCWALGNINNYETEEEDKKTEDMLER